MQLGQGALAASPTAIGSDWLLSNGLGGSSCGTATGIRVRPAEALLTASLEQGRIVTLLLAVHERLHAEAWTADIARGTGGVTLESFRSSPLPAWTIDANGVRFERSVFLVAGHNAVAIRWRHLGGPDARLVVSPLVVSRGPHELQRERADTANVRTDVPGRVRVEISPVSPALTLWHNGAFIPARVWNRIDYAALADPATGEPASEHALMPGYIESMFPAGSTLQLVAAAEDDLFRALAREDRLGSPPPKTLAECVARLEADERAERTAWRKRAIEGANETARQAIASRPARPAAADEEGAAATTGVKTGGPRSSGRAAAAARRDIDEALAEFEIARKQRGAGVLGEHDGWTAPLADQLLAGLTRRGHRLTFVSSLPTAPERGTHILRAVPALIAIRSFETAREVLRGMIEYLDEGLAPESFAHDGTPRYGDPAASLWLVHAAELYARRSGDLDFTNRVIAPAVESVMQSYRMGTRHGIGVDEDGLLQGGSPGVKRADVNILWYHALVAMAQLSKITKRKEQGAFFLAWAREHQARFLDSFWNEPAGELFDRIEAGTPREGIAASHVLAVSLSPAILPPEQAARFVEGMRAKLAVPGGLREAEPSGRARPDWLAHLIVAWLRVHGRSDASQLVVEGWLAELEAVRERTGLDALPGWVEIGDAPGKAAGLPIAADPLSSLAASEMLRVWIEDVEHAAEQVEAPSG